MRVVLMGLVLAWMLQEKGPSTRVDEIVGEVKQENLKKTLEKLVSFETRSSVSETESEKRGIGAARKWIKSEFEAIAKGAKGGMTVEFHDFSITVRGREIPQKNVYAVLKGKKNPKRAVVFGAHYDTINLKDRDPNASAPGADDDGSGSAAVIEACRLLSKYEFDNSIVFVCFSSEEQGLFGSRAFAEHLKKSEYDVLAMLNNDIVGGVDDSKEGSNDKDCRCFSDPKHEASRQFARWVKSVVEPRVPGFAVKLQDAADRPGRGGDHQSFNSAGFTAIRLIESYENLEHQHSPSDTLDHVRFEYLRKMAQVDVAIVVTLAQAPAAPAAPRIVKQEGQFIVKWGAVPGARGYKVALRRGHLEFAEVLSCAEASHTILSDGKDLTVSVCAEGPGGECSLFSLETSVPKE